jgi:hypothetical protein
VFPLFYHRNYVFILSLTTSTLCAGSFQNLRLPKRFLTSCRFSSSGWAVPLPRSRNACWLWHVIGSRQRLTLPELFLGAEDHRVCERKRSPHHLSALTHRLWLRMILHLYVVCDGYRFGSQPRLSTVASSRYAVAWPPRRPESVAPRPRVRRRERLHA